jgi:hypothetical protein|tara:strand:+ start:43 stop:777 length:735 start_codon:yes stop_codon:yes gene_type:complete
MADFKLATEIVDLPSKGYLYSKDSSLADGKIEIKYMTAKEEDILTNSSYIQKGTVLDKLFQSLIVSKIDYNELLIGDKNAIMIAARILGYGKDYAFTYEGVEETVDLTEVNNSEIDDDLFKSGKNEFSFTFPHSGNEITFKLLNHGDETKIQRELDGLKKIDKNSDPTLTTRLKHTILSVEGKTEKKDIREFVDKYLLARDARALREYIKSMSPDVDLTFFPSGRETTKTIPIGVGFFWPDFGK